MFHSRTLNNRTNKLHEKSSNFEELLERDRSVSVHTRNLQTLATEIFKVSQQSISANISKDIFSLIPNTEYNLRQQFQFIIL